MFKVSLPFLRESKLKIPTVNPTSGLLKTSLHPKSNPAASKCEQSLSQFFQGLSPQDLEVVIQRMANAAKTDPTKTFSSAIGLAEQIQRTK